MARRDRPVDQPVTGKTVFQHESGIHCSAMAHSRQSYELFHAGEVGQAIPDFVIGLHSGSEGIVQALAGHGIVASREVAKKMLGPVRSLARRRSRALKPGEVAHIFRQTSTRLTVE